MFGFGRSMVGRQAPDISGEAWFNKKALPESARVRVAEGKAVRLDEDLAGNVVLVQIWDYSCRHCVSSLLRMRELWKNYRGQDFLIIGVHTPEFEYERDSDKVQDAVIRFDLSYPVVNDSEYETWDRYHNKVWPRFLVVSKEGRVLYDQNGEGKYDEIETTIQGALK